jgi:hypothetical protein
VSILLTNLANDLARRMEGDPLTRHSPHKRLLNSPDAVDNDAGGVRLGDRFVRALSPAATAPTKTTSRNTSATKKTYSGPSWRGTSDEGLWRYPSPCT